MISKKQKQKQKTKKTKKKIHLIHFVTFIGNTYISVQKLSHFGIFINFTPFKMR